MQNGRDFNTTVQAGIDRATKALYPDLQKRFDKKGFYLSSIGDVGRARIDVLGAAEPGRLRDEGEAAQGRFCN